VKFQREQFRDIYQEFPPLFAAHFHEIARDRERIPLAPDWESYMDLERRGRLFVFTARVPELVGYFFADVGPGLHNRTSIMAVTDMYYLKPEHRVGMNGYRFLKAAIDTLKFDKFAIQTKREPDVGPIFKRLGLAAVETVYTKVS